MDIKELHRKIQEDQARENEDAPAEGPPDKGAKRGELSKLFARQWGHMACNKDYKDCQCRNGEHEVRQAIYQIGEWIKTI